MLVGSGLEWQPYQLEIIGSNPAQGSSAVTSADCLERIICLALICRMYMFMGIFPKQYCDIPPPPPGELAGALCHVEGGGVCGELMPFISGGIQGNLERDSGEMDQQSDLVERLAHSSSSSSPPGSPICKEGEDRVKV